MNPLSVVPWWIKYPVLAIGLIAYAPSWVAEKYDQRWVLNAAPHIRERDKQFDQMDLRLERIERNTETIQKILMEKNR